MEVLKITPRGYCHGVVDAFRIAKRVREETDGPVHMLGMLVHNTHATDDLQRQGVALVDQPNRLAGLEQVKEGTVIFTAHGVSPQVKQRAVELGLTPVDATCSDVVRTHELVADLARKGYQVVYIGRKGHPEPEGVMGEAPDNVHLVQDPEDIDALELNGDRIAVTCQTTLSVWDTEDLIGRVKTRYPHAEVYNEICRATQERQEAAVEAAKEVDLVIVAGGRAGRAPAPPPARRAGRSFRLGGGCRRRGHGRRLWEGSIGPGPAASPSRCGGSGDRGDRLLRGPLAGNRHAAFDLGADLALGAKGAIGGVDVDPPDDDRGRRAGQRAPLLSQRPPGVDRVACMHRPGKFPVQPLPLGDGGHWHVDRAQ